MMEKAKEMAEKQRQSQEQTNETSQPEPQQQPDRQEQPTTEMPDTPQEQDETQNDPLDEWANQPPQMPELPEFKFDLPNHDVWEDVDKQQDKLQQDEDADMSDMEKQFYQQNERELAKQAMQYFQSQNMGEQGTFHIGSDELSWARPAKELDWKKLLKKNLDVEVEAWSDRRADAENDFASRLEEVEREDKVHTEVMLDISGSVDIDLLKEFLRQLKPLLKDSTLDVGYFNNTATEYTRVRTAKDIEKLDVPNPHGWTNLDAAVRSFSKNRRTNKIVFSDGDGYMPDEDLKNVNVIWVIYGHEVDEFAPCCGKVIRVDENKMIEEGNTRRNYLLKEANLSRRQ